MYSKQLIFSGIEFSFNPNGLTILINGQAHELSESEAIDLANNISMYFDTTTLPSKIPSPSIAQSDTIEKLLFDNNHRPSNNSSANEIDPFESFYDPNI